MERRSEEKERRKENKKEGVRKREGRREKVGKEGGKEEKPMGSERRKAFIKGGRI